jgi:hypothetical protein
MARALPRMSLVWPAIMLIVTPGSDARLGDDLMTVHAKTALALMIGTVLVGLGFGALHAQTRLHRPIGSPKF